MTGLEIKSLPIDLGQIPQGWQQVVPCKVNLISLKVEHVVWSITVVTTSQQVLGGVTYPSGDVVAAFRVCEPDKYGFSRHKSFSDRCCPSEPDTGNDPPEESEWFDENGLVLVAIEVPGYQFDWGYKYDLNWRLHLKYGWPRFQYEDD